MNWILRHPAIAAMIGTWIFNNIVTVLVSSLPAPGQASSASYIYWFKVANTIIGNIARANSTALEKSPNWEAAVNAHMAKLAANASNGPDFPITTSPTKGTTP